MTTDILQSPLSPTQERGEPTLSGKILHEKITNSEGEEVNLRIDYTVEGDIIVSHHSYHTYGNDSIPPTHLQEIVEELVEQTEGHTLIFE